MKPQNCPFCGNEATAEEMYNETYVGDQKYNVGCDNRSCGFIGPDMDSTESAISAWNRIRLEQDP